MIVVITNVFAFTRPITLVNTFGDRLRHARKLRKLTQAELARACGLSQGAIGNYETDSRRSAKNVFRIADVLNVDAAWLAMGTGPMERQAPQRLLEGPSFSTNTPAWPFPDIDPARIWSLSTQQREILGNALIGMIAAMEDGATDPHG